AKCGATLGKAFAATRPWPTARTGVILWQGGANTRSSYVTRRPARSCAIWNASVQSLATGELVEFASKLFGVLFPRDSVITEDRLDMGEYLTDDEEYPDLPTPTP